MHSECTHLHRKSADKGTSFASALPRRSTGGMVPSVVGAHNARWGLGANCALHTSKNSGQVL